MATSYKIFKEIGLISVTSSGPANFEEVRVMLVRLLADPDFSMSYNVLWDASERTKAFTSDEVKKLASYAVPYEGNKRPKRAYLVSKDVDYGMLRVYESYRDIRSNVDINIFKDRVEALEWLGLHNHPLFCSDKRST